MLLLNVLLIDCYDSRGFKRGNDLIGVCDFFVDFREKREIRCFSRVMDKKEDFLNVFFRV